MRVLRVVLVAGALLAADRGAAQYPPPPSAPPTAPPPYYPPPPPPPPPQAVPPQYRLALPPVPNNVLRLSAGMSLLSEAYDCWYGYYAGGCAYGYNAAFPIVNLDADLGLTPNLALTVGGNVMWGSINGVNNTIWEPHLDLLLRGSPYSDIRGRLRLGLGIYAAYASGGNSTLGGGGSNDTGAAFRIGAGVSFMNRSKIGIGLDAIFEAGTIGGYEVSTIQLLVGPELHF